MRLALLFLVALSAFAADPSGSCTTGTPPITNVADGKLFVCQSGTWTEYTTGGSSNSTQIQGRSVANTAPSDGNALVWSASNSQWQPGSAVAGSTTWGSITGTLSNQTDLQTALSGKQNTLTLPLSIANGGNGTATPGIQQGNNVTVSGSWPTQTIAIPNLYNQTVENAGTPVTQRSKLNFAGSNGITVTPTDNGTDTSTFTFGISGYQASGNYLSTILDNGAAQTQEPKLNLIPGSNVTITCADNSGATSTDCTFAASATGSTAFSALTGSTNTTAAMLVGTGASLGPTGTGTISATSVTGLSVTSGKTLAANNSITLAGTDSTTMTFPGTSQTVPGLGQANTWTSGLQDFSATAFKPNAGASNPGTCAIGQVFFNTAATAGQNWYFCTGTNTWTQQLNTSTPAFSAITAGTNTAALLIGTGGSLAPTGTGTISANQYNGAKLARAIGYSFDGGGSALTSGKVGYLTVPWGCTISAWNIAVDTGTATIKVWKIASGTAIPTSSNSINTSGVAISTGTAVHSTTLTDFTTTTVTANDIVGIDLSAVSSATFVNFTLQCDQ